MAEILETGITWEHDTGEICISTRSRRVAERLRSLGFEGDGGEDYENFRCSEDELGITFRRRRRATAAQREHLARLARARSQKFISMEIPDGKGAPEGVSRGGA